MAKKTSKSKAPKREVKKSVKRLKQDLHQLHPSQIELDGAINRAFEKWAEVVCSECSAMIFQKNKPPPYDAEKWIQTDQTAKAIDQLGHNVATLKAHVDSSQDLAALKTSNQENRIAVLESQIKTLCEVKEWSRICRALDQLGRDVAELKAEQNIMAVDHVNFGDEWSDHKRGNTRSSDQLHNIVGVIRVDVAHLKESNNAMGGLVRELRSDLSGDLSVLKTSNKALVQRFSELHSTVVSLQVDKGVGRSKQHICPRCHAHNTTALHQYYGDRRVKVSTRWCNQCGDSYEPN